LDCRVSGAGARLTGFIDADSIRPGLDVEFQLGESDGLQGTVQSYESSFSVNLRGREYEVAHLYTVNSRVVPGDSGGIVYAADQAVGVVVAQSPDAAWAWVQRLESALSYLNSIQPTSSIRCF